MRKIIFPLLSWFALLPTLSFAQQADSDQLSIVYANRPKGELVILVARTKAFSEQPGLCGNDKNCLAMDSHYLGKFHVEKVLAGELDEKEIDVNFYYHTWAEPFYRADYALVFLRKSNGHLVEVKYMSKPVFKTKHGDWALCLDEKTARDIKPVVNPRILLDWLDVYEADPSNGPVQKRKYYQCKYSVSAEALAADFSKREANKKDAEDADAD